MVTRPFGPLVRLRALLGPDDAGVLQSLAALGVSGVTALVAGLTLGSVDDTLTRFPGLLLLVPAAIALRGNIFGALGSRLGTSIHAGSFRLTSRLDTHVGQNMVAALVLNLALAVVLAVLAKGVAVAFDVGDTMGIDDFVVISVGGAVLASVVLLGITVGLAAGAVRYGWNLDNVVSPLVTAAGDLVTIPALMLATVLADRGALTPILATVFAAAGLAAVLAPFRTALEELRRIVRQSVPVLLVAAVFDLVAGITVEKRLEDFLQYKALLVMIPGYLGAAGSLGGILSNRLSTKFHLGLADPVAVPQRQARDDIRTVLMLAVPVFAFLGTVSHLGATAAGFASPGLATMVGVALAGGLAAMVFVLTIAYYGTVAAVRLGLDPDSYGIPMVTSSLDFIGAFTLIVAIVSLGAT